MLSKSEIKDIQSLSQKKYRRELKLFVAEGPKIVAELVQLIPSQIKQIYAVSSWIRSNSHLDHSNTIEVTEEELERISSLKTPNEAAAIVRQFENIEPVAFDIALYLDQIQDPGNLGTILRTADWFGIKHVVCSEGCADIYNAKVIQSTMASIARVNVYYEADGNWLMKQTLPVYAAALEGESIYEHEKIVQGIIVIGNESKGIRAEILQSATKKVTIPGRGEAESLNAAVATGVILSHLLK